MQTFSDSVNARVEDGRSVQTARPLWKPPRSTFTFGGAGPSPRFSTVEEMIKRKEWRGSKVSAPFKKTYTGVEYDCFDSLCGKGKDRHAHKVDETVDVVEVRHPSGCVATIRVVRGDDLKAWRAEQRQAIRFAVLNSYAEKKLEAEAARQRVEAERERLAPLRAAESRATSLQQAVESIQRQIQQSDAVLAELQKRLAANQTELGAAQAERERLRKELGVA